MSSAGAEDAKYASHRAGFVGFYLQADEDLNESLKWRPTWWKPTDQLQLASAQIRNAFLLRNPATASAWKNRNIQNESPHFTMKLLKKSILRLLNLLSLNQFTLRFLGFSLRMKTPLHYSQKLVLQK